MRSHHGNLVPIASLVLFCLLTPFVAGAEPCELAVAVRESDRLAYQERGKRCEGRYIEEVSGETIAIISFTSLLQDYDLSDGRDLKVSWSTPDDVTMHLRGRSLEPKIYYQMDTTRPASEGVFEWPVNILSGLDIQPSKLGVVGFYRGRIGSIETNIYVPVGISQANANKGVEEYRLLLRPGVQLHEVYVSLERIDIKGNSLQLILDEEPLRQGFYPAERVFQVPITNSSDPGLYHLLIAAEPTSGGTILVKELYFWIHA